MCTKTESSHLTKIVNERPKEFTLERKRRPKLERTYEVCVASMSCVARSKRERFRVKQENRFRF
ncbi:hypothetical protein HanRHA438_Chr09g0375501 [Helianthus annuus]|nr:hypothetical protein HanRHA438_Chr09g0375501 [Helianthus annuus]